MLECVINVSEGQRPEVVAAIAAPAGPHLLDLHRDVDHHRSVLTLAGPRVEEAAFAVVAAAVVHIDLRRHAGAHPRLGAADVVPFVALDGSTDADALAARDWLVGRVAGELGVPCFRYGPERTLPEVRRRAFVDLAPDAGPDRPHESAGATCVGVRPVLVAYNLWLAPPATIEQARHIAAGLRSPWVRALGLVCGDRVQVSCNLLGPTRTRPDEVFDAVAAQAAVARAELVGLVPAAVLEAIPARRWPALDLSPATTIEARLKAAGLDGGRFDSGVS